MDFKNYTLLKMCDLDMPSGCMLAVEHLKLYYPDSPMAHYKLGDELYVTFTAKDRSQTYTYSASDLLKYVVTELGKRPKPTRSKIPRADADLYQPNPERLREILQSFVDAHIEEFVPF
jgi:hypothetical protein